MTPEQVYETLESLTISPGSRLLIAREAGICGWSPYPNYGGYSHWYCQRKRRHFGRHRFVNYVAGRIIHRRVHYKPTLRTSYAWASAHQTEEAGKR